MEVSALAQKQADFEVFDILDRIEDSDAPVNSQQAALNLDLPSQEPKKYRRLSPGKRLPPRPSTTQQKRPTPAPEPGPVAKRSRTETSKQQSRSAGTGKSSKPSAEVIIIGDTSSEDEQDIRDHFDHPSTLRTVIPSTYIDVPRKIPREKRKCDDVIPLLPEKLQFFKDSKIYFFPNNDIDMGRRIRIFRAVERGATWVKTWHHNVTHLVVDNNMKLPDLLKELRLDELPVDVILVNDEYVPACVEAKARLDPAQLQFHVRGSLFGTSRVAAPPRRPVTPQPTSEKTLQLKPPKKQKQRELQITPGRSGSSRGDSDDELEHVEARPLEARTVKDQNPSVIVVPDGQPSTKTSVPPVEASESALNEAINEAKDAAHLSSDPDEEDGDEGQVPSRPTSAQSTDVPQWQRGFTCMQDPASRPTSSSGPNARTINLLQQLERHYTSVKDEWRSKAYQTAMKALQRCRNEITTAEEAMKVRGIGKRLADKIEEIHSTSRLRRLENALLEPEDKALKTFLGIYGVGFAQAQTWTRQGLRTLDDLRKRNVPLTTNQQVGLEHYDDFNTRIPRAEVTQLGVVVEKELKHIDPDFQLIIGGSYRRGSETSGDIDIVITHPTNSIVYTRQIVLQTLVPRLEKKQFLVAGLAVTSRDDGTKWHGACVLPHSNTANRNPGAASPRPWRRIDLLLVPHDELGAALLYFTGNDIFNRSMRLLARKKGMRLNQRGLYTDVVRATNQQRTTDGNQIAGRSERDIFEALGVPWRECTERDC
ncbi:MAG: hypothetical protein Q9162_002678 [Coniocarpon cinnabarinum]